MVKYARCIQVRAKMTREFKHNHSQCFHLPVNKPSCNFNLRILTKLGIFALVQYIGAARTLLVCIPSTQPPHYIDMHGLRILFKKKQY